MSDDLISRKALYERVEKSMNENPHSDSKVKQMHNHEHRHFLCMIMQEPTAFDKETVIEELSNLKEDEKKYLNEFGDKDSLRGMQCYERAIEIVEKGGIG